MQTYSGIGCYEDVLAMEAAGKPELPASTYDMIRQGAARDPHAPALTFFLQADEHKDPETWTYQALLEQIHQTANFLHKLGADKDTVIAYILPNLPETHFIIWGGQATGIVAAINPLLEPEAMADLLNAAGASILVTLAPFPGTDLFAKVSQMLPKVRGIRHLVLVNLCDRVRGAKKQGAKELQQMEVLRLCGSGLLSSRLPAQILVHDFAEAIDSQTKDKLNSARVFSSSDYSSYFCTGGTTGAPKIAVRTHGNEVANAWSASQFFGSDTAKPRKVFCGLPLFHVNAVLVTGLLPFSIGGQVILGTPQGYRGEGVVSRFWELVEHHQINSFSGVPTLYASLMQVPIGDRDISSLDYALCGAAPMPVEVFRRFQDITGVKILEGYGLTEGTCVSSVNPLRGERRPSSIGLRVPGQQMKTVLLDEQQHYVRDCVTEEVGVIVISGPNVFSGYKIAEQNQHLWVQMDDGQLWLNTGDLGRQDAEGYFWLTGRKKELIIRGGHNIDPSSIEEVLHQHPAVQVAAAVGRPDPQVGELPVAYVQLKPGASTTVSELMEFAKQQIVERAAVPKQIQIVDAIPLTAVGKIFKPALKHLEIRNALSASLREAGLEHFNLDVSEDKTLGISLLVQLESSNDKAQAEQVLGQYPFHFKLEDDFKSAAVP
ncbi:acyl-CoA synthetase [Shewanella profunda]|uniref:acyl-CoA synthetase n=1 Tax=Shewanella profunda TaxID=254793 RepID=UPI00200CBDE6|nr:acyl-CoA synthetase [Shewanella profunda]MCL1089119.1 acyl-CoA synthetase [Shewanella profunda]